MDGACEFRHRMLELLNEEEPPNPGAVLVGAGRWGRGRKPCHWWRNGTGRHLGDPFAKRFFTAWLTLCEDLLKQVFSVLLFGVFWQCCHRRDGESLPKHHTLLSINVLL